MRSRKVAPLSRRKQRPAVGSRAGVHLIRGARSAVAQGSRPATQWERSARRCGCRLCGAAGACLVSHSIWIPCALPPPLFGLCFLIRHHHPRVHYAAWRGRDDEQKCRVCEILCVLSRGLLPARIRTYTWAEIRSTFDPRNDLRCSEHVITMFFRVV